MPLTKGREEIKRTLYLTQTARDWISPPAAHPEGISDEALMKAQAVLSAFIRGKELIEDEDLKHLEKWLIPNDREVWEFRSGLELKKLQLRIFGWFPQPNHFVAVHGKRRGDLGEFGSNAWEKSIKRVVEVRRDLLPSEPIYRGVSYADYIN